MACHCILISEILKADTYITVGYSPPEIEIIRRSEDGAVYTVYVLKFNYVGRSDPQHKTFILI
jgi:hypothetical protein